MKYITSFLLVLVISISGLPVFLVEDASHDGTVDLQDAILQVQDFSESADSSFSFALGFEKMLHTLSSVAGLKNFIDPNKESKSSKHQSNLVITPAKITNSFSIKLPPLLTGRETYSEKPLLYESRASDPSIPPPRIS